jgi:hypothetical protein
MQLSRPLRPDQRTVFVELLIAKLNGRREIGDGTLYQLCRELQRQLFSPPLDGRAGERHGVREVAMRRIVTPPALAVAALVSAHVLAGAEPVPALRLLPIQVQKEIEETRANCRELGVRADAIYDDAGVTRFTLPGGTDAVLVNDGEVCGGERIKGANCATGGCAVTVYARVRGAWRKVVAGRNDPFVSADWTRDPPALRILVVSLFGDAPECPVREANLRAHGSTAWKFGQCDVVARWDGTRFVYRMLVP